VDHRVRRPEILFDEDYATKWARATARRRLNI
jgi:hypothetical protein